MKTLSAIAFLVCIFSYTHAGFFNFGVGRDVDIFIRETDNSQCRWYNSGILSWIARRVNGTTYCRCSAVGMYECKTYITRVRTASTTAKTNTTSINVTGSTPIISTSLSSGNVTDAPAPTALP